MKSFHLVLSCCLATACVDDGEPGAAGPRGPEGPSGKQGEGLVWKDAGGAVLANAYATFQTSSFAMIVKDDDGVFHAINPLNGEPRPAIVNSANLTRFFLSSNCSGPPRYSVEIAPKIAFKFDGRLVALPPDVEVGALAGSFQGSLGCTATQSPGAFIIAKTIEELPLVTPPLIAPGPYHVEPN